MKAKDLVKLLESVDPEAEVYIDLGLIHDVSKEFVYALLTYQGYTSADIEQVSLSCFRDGIKEVYLLPYDGKYALDDKKTVDAFFKEHDLDKVWEASRE